MSIFGCVELLSVVLRRVIVDVVSTIDGVSGGVGVVVFYCLCFVCIYKVCD